MRININDFGVDTISLAGSLRFKLDATREAGFSQIMLSARDVAAHPSGFRAAVEEVKSSGLRVTAFQALRDYEGLSEHLHEYKLDVAKSMLQMCFELDSKVLLVCSSTSSHSASEDELFARDLRKLAVLAIPFGIKIAYEALSWGKSISEYTRAWDIVCKADMPNLGICLDSFHLIASQSSTEEISFLDPEKIFLVQLSDFMWTEIKSVKDRISTARHFRVFPGEGVHTEILIDIVNRLDTLGYRGDYSFEVFNDDYSQMPAATVAARAKKSALWLSEDILNRSVPLPESIRRSRVSSLNY